jgi:hypothetical protein
MGNSPPMSFVTAQIVMLRNTEMLIMIARIICRFCHFAFQSAIEQLTLNEKLRDGTATGKPNIPEASHKTPLDVTVTKGKSSRSGEAKKSNNLHNRNRRNRA